MYFIVALLLLCQRNIKYINHVFYISYVLFMSVLLLCKSPHSAGVRLSSLQLFCQTSVSFSQQDELLVQQEDMLLQLLTAAQLEIHRRQ